MSEPVVIDAEIVGELPAPLSARAERYRGHLRSSSEEALKAFAELTAARQEAAHGEWGLWLQQAGIDDATARNQLQLYEQIQQDPRFADRFRAGWLSLSAGAELMRAPAAVKDAVLSRPLESPKPTVKEIRTEKAAAPNRSTSSDLKSSPAAGAKPPLVLTPFTTTPPAGAPTVIASIPADGLPPVLQLGVSAALPPPLFSPPPVAEAPAAPNPAPAEEFALLAARMQAAGMSLAWDGERFRLYEGGKGPDARYSGYQPFDWETCRRRCEYLLAPPATSAPAPTPSVESAPDTDGPDPEAYAFGCSAAGDAVVLVLREGGQPVIDDAIAALAAALRSLTRQDPVSTEVLDELTGKLGELTTHPGVSTLIAALEDVATDAEQLGYRR